MLMSQPGKTAEGGTLLLPAPPPLQGRNCGDPAETRWGRGHTHQGVGPEAVGQHHPLAESLVFVIFLGVLFLVSDFPTIQCKHGCPVESPGEY